MDVRDDGKVESLGSVIGGSRGTPGIGLKSLRKVGTASPHGGTGVQCKVSLNLREGLP